MTGNATIFKVIRAVVIGTLVCGLIFGLAGFLLAGKVGFVNMVTWGLVIGFFGGLVLGASMLLSPHYLGLILKNSVSIVWVNGFGSSSDQTKVSERTISISLTLLPPNDKLALSYSLKGGTKK